MIGGAGSINFPSVRTRPDVQMGMTNAERISVPCTVEYRGFTIVLAGDPSMASWTVQTRTGVPVASGLGACGFDQDDDTGEFVGPFQTAFEDALDRAREHAEALASA